jgi:tetratricopeptide (TPR) repeat protein
MRARYEADQLTRDSLLRAIGDYQRAIEIDPRYAAAYYGLAVARHRLPTFANDPHLFDRAAIEAAYQKAIDLDPNFPEPHTGLALLAAYADWDWARAEHELETASAIAPNAMAESHSALLALIRGRRAMVLEHIRRARDLDPLGVAILMNTAEIQIMAGEWQPARELLERFSAQHPEVDNARWWVALSFLFEGKPAEAILRLESLQRKIPERDAYLAGAHALAGRKHEALRLIRAYEQRPDPSYSGVAAAYGYLRDEAQVFSWLEKAIARHESEAAYLGVHPAFAFLRGNPAFQQLARAHGISY